MNLKICKFIYKKELTSALNVTYVYMITTVTLTEVTHKNGNISQKIYLYTVKPLNNGYPWDQ